MECVRGKMECVREKMDCVEKKIGEMEWVVSERRWERCRRYSAVRNQRYRVSPLGWVLLNMIMYNMIGGKEIK